MKQYLKIITLLVCIGLLSSGVCQAFTFTVTTIDRETGQESVPGDPGFGVQFDPSGVQIPPPDSSGSEAWAIGKSAVRVRYSCGYAEWGVTVSTDNLTTWPDMAPLYSDKGPDGYWGNEPDAPPGSEWDNGVLYSGLISETMRADPSMRCILGWQVFKMVGNSLPYNDPNDPALDIIDDNPDDKNADGDPTDPHEIRGTWNADWKYVADVMNCPYNESTGEYEPYDVSDVYRWVKPTGQTGYYVFNYLYSIYGWANGNSSLQMKWAPPGPNGEPNGTMESVSASYARDYGVAIYFAARFVGFGYDEAGNRTNVSLPAGYYGSTIWVRLLHI